MKILFFCRLFAPHIGGVEKHVMEVSKVLIQKGHDVTVITERLDKRPHPDPLLRGEGASTNSLKGEGEIIEGIRVHRIDPGRDDWYKKFRIWKELSRLKKVIEGADVVHCHDVFFWYLPFRFTYPQKPVFTTFHGYETTYPPTAGAISVRKMSEQLSMGNICVGDFIKKWYGTRPTVVTYGGAAPVPVKPHPTPLLRGEGASTNSSKGEGKKVKIAFIGRLDADTGLLFFKQTVQLLQDKKVKVSFDIYGEGPLRDEVEKIGKLHGSVSDIEKAIEKSDIIFASSYLSILESLAQKKLVFATYSNPLKEDYLRMALFAPFIIIENDPEKMVQKIEYYMEHPKEAQKLIDAGYTWAREQTWEKLTDTYLRLWKR